MKTNMLVGSSPRCGKTLMSEVIDSICRTINIAYDEAYSQVFDELKKADDGLSDDDINNFIEKFIEFDVDVKYGSLMETPEIVLTPKWKEITLEGIEND